MLRLRESTLNKEQKLEVGEFLTLPGAKNSGMFGRPALMFTVSKRSKHPEVAAKFLNFLLTDPEAARLLGLSRGVPAADSQFHTLVKESRIALPDALPSPAAGVFGYLGYDTVRLMEELPEPNPDPIGIPDAVLVRPTLVVVFDAVKDSITVVTPVRPERGVDAKAALARATERLSRVVESLDKPLDKSFSVPGLNNTIMPWHIGSDGSVTNGIGV